LAKAPLPYPTKKKKKQRKKKNIVSRQYVAGNTDIRNLLNHGSFNKPLPFLSLYFHLSQKNINSKHSLTFFTFYITSITFFTFFISLFYITSITFYFHSTKIFSHKGRGGEGREITKLIACLRPVH
jgi:hypothetical protein